MKLTGILYGLDTYESIYRLDQSVRIEITEEMIERVEHHAQRRLERDMRRARTVWQGKLRGEKKDSHFLGLIGEEAFGAYFGLPVDYSFLQNGYDEGYDFTWKGNRIDVKSKDNLKFGNYLVKHERRKCDGYAFCRVSPLVREEGFRWVDIEGWISWRFLHSDRFPLEISPRAASSCKWWNRNIDNVHLRPIQELLKPIWESQ